MNSAPTPWSILAVMGRSNGCRAKDVAQSEDDAGEVLISDLPHAYYYLVDGGGEYLQAKRRSQAVIISHLTPPLAAAGSNPDYAKIRESLEHRRQLEDGDPALQAQYSAEILAEAKRL
jgi:cobaltochelatase CobN